MICPKCKSRRTKVLRETQHKEGGQSDFLRMCRNPQCNTMFFTSEDMVGIVPGTGPVDEFTKQIHALGPRQQKELRAFLDKLSKKDAGKE